jgi:5'-methylthioinosine phosphorylase
VAWITKAIGEINQGFMLLHSESKMTTSRTPLGLISSLDLSQSLQLTNSHSQTLTTPYGEPSAPLICAELTGQPVILLQRHGNRQQIPPHKINYRANLWALRELGVQPVIGIATVGGIQAELGPGSLCIADQIIDYTYGREHTYATALDSSFGHIEFGSPFSTTLRKTVITAAQQCKIDCATTGVYGATQGPRLETAAEIRRMQRDGCDLVGMTGMPEASLAREIELEYANLSLVVNWAAGLEAKPINLDEIKQYQTTGMQVIYQIVRQVCRNLSQSV